MSDDLIKIEVDGKELEGKRGQMLIEITDANDIYIPRFCYHPKLSVAANCRMCLVEVEKSPKPLPACATPAIDGMVVKTQSEQAIGSQKSVMEFLLINHPLDCPICDQGGECELQDLAMGYGRDVSQYQESKRVVKDKNIGPLVQTEMTRCIHCTRCVRFGEEIAGMRELGATGRGEHMQIGTYIEKSMKSELSGNIIDVCPVGALTSKPFRYSARAWEMRQGKSIAPHDCVGSNVEIHFKGHDVKRVVPAENEAVNEIWLSDRDRFSYEGLYADDRLTTPMIKQDGEWQEVDWDVALDFCAKGLNQVKENSSAENIGALVSPSATVEEQFLLQSLMRSLGSNNIDHRLMQQDFRHEKSEPAFPFLGQSIEDLEQLDAALLIGSQIRKQQPLLNLRLRKAALKGASIMTLSESDCDLNYAVAENIVANSNGFVNELAAITKAVVEQSNARPNANVDSLLNNAQPGESHKAIAEHLINANTGTLLIGGEAIAHADFATIQTLASVIAGSANVNLGYLTEGANSAGAWLVGAVPHRGVNQASVSSTGLNTQAMLEKQLSAYVLFHVEADKDLLNRDQARSALNNAELVISMCAFKSDAMMDHSDVLLPIALFAENEGTYINVEGRAQSFEQVVPALGEARPGWKILRVLGNKLELDGFEQDSIKDIQQGLLPKLQSAQVNATVDYAMPSGNALNGSAVAVRPYVMYGIDPLVRRAESLQEVDQ